MSELIKCNICNEYEGSERQVISHKIHCKKKEETVNPMNVEPRKREQSDRKKRVPFGQPEKRLNAPEDDEYVYRVFNDNWRKEPQRIQRAEQAGYEHVEGWKEVAVGTNDDGSPIKGRLMRIPKEMYEEDQRAKQREIDRVDEAILKGKLEERAGDNRYIPQGIKIHSNNRENG